MERLQQGDEAAFCSLVENWKDRVYNTALGLLQHEEDAKDLTQDIFISVWRSAPRFRGGSSLSTWLYRITVNRALDVIRLRKRKKRFGFIANLRGNGYGNTGEVDFHHPGVELEKKQDAVILFHAIRKLPEKQQTAFVLQKLEGLTNPEIAGIMELNVGAVESLQQRAKANLRKTLNTLFEENIRS